MGLNIPQWKFMNKSFRETGLLSKGKLPHYEVLLTKEKYFGKNMLELGCQEIRERVRQALKSKATAKSYFKSIGINHTSIDIKGCHRSKAFDLREPINKKYHNRFDIITNSGTTEHIVPLEGQYQAFKNIHDCAKIGAVMIHILPGIGEYYGHCQIYYENKFFLKLAADNGYKIILKEPVKDRPKFVWMGVCLVKQSDQEFTDDKNSFLKHIQFIKKTLYKKHKKNKPKYMI